MKKSQLLLFTVGLSLCSCSTINHTASTVPVNTEVYNLTVADLNVSEKKDTFTTEWKWNPFSSVSLSAQKETAQHELLNRADADVIVDPQITVERRGFMRGGSVTVSGYPAKYSNFRPMTREDAENIGIINGNISTVVVSPVVATSNGVFIEPGKKQKVKSERSKRSHFIDVLYGPQLECGYSNDPDSQFGLIYGAHGSRWGWYVKGSLIKSTGDEYSGFITAGFIKTISSQWNFLMGLGCGGNIFYDRSYYYYSEEEAFTVPVEAAIQWHKGHFNIMVGVNYSSNFTHYYNDMLTPQIGIGYTF